MKLEPIGIRRLEALHYYVHDLERSRRFYTRMMDFAETAVSSPELDRDFHQRSALFEAGGVRVLVSEPSGTGPSDASLHLRKHPDGVGTLVFEVDDIDRTFRLVESRGGTPIDRRRQRVKDGGGTFQTFGITTPVRRHHVPLRRASRLPRPLPGHGPPPRAPRRQEPLRLRAHRPRHLQLPDHEAGAALDGARARLRGVLGGAVPHHRRDEAARRRSRPTAPACTRW